MLKILTALLVFVGLFVVINVVSVNVCHATGSDTNPYNLIVVAIHSVNDANGLNGHGNHGDDAWMPFEFEGVLYPGQNESLFGDLINEDCSLIVEPTQTSTPTNTSVPPTPTNTSTNTPVPTDPVETQPVVITSTPTMTLPPPPTPTNTPIIPYTPTMTPTLPPYTETPSPTNTPSATSTPLPQPTDTPFPPKPASGNEDTGVYPSSEIGALILGGDTYPLYLGVNAEDGSLLLPSYNKGAALYLKTIWVHRLWKSGWLDLQVGDTIYFENIVGVGKTYTITDKSYIDYGVYPRIEAYGDAFQYIATCYSDDAGKWLGVELFELQMEK